MYTNDTLPVEFELSALPQVKFGPGRHRELPELIQSFGRTVLMLTGGASFFGSERWDDLTRELDQQGINWRQMTVSGEPSPTLVDDTVKRYRETGIEVVVAIGGGSVMDAAKAIAGLLPFGNSVLDHLEGVGKGLSYTGPSLPLIAVPTTAGTGSEATRNAVLSVHGTEGYKKSFRHPSLVPRVAVLDPQLLESCPPTLIAAQGMDAFTQLMESYVSTRANPFCDALALSGLTAFNRGFWSAWEGGESPAAQQGRAAMLYAAYLSGVTLAQVGLGSVHGLASPLGAFFPIPHGVVCGTLVAEATAVNLAALAERLPNSPARARYAEIGRLLQGQEGIDDEAARQSLVDLLREWTQKLALPSLSEYGVTSDDIPRIVANSRGNSMKTNPLVLTDEEIAEVVRRRL
ncbi:MAG: iron-containing alcohol dehydrogenase [Gammaproteobacteria bacterium]|nr:iron-containing alcohol dehydrogenase [Gammaproteobacteria bacterium]